MYHSAFTRFILLVALSLLGQAPLMAQPQPQPAEPSRFALAIHGGAIGNLNAISEPVRARRLESLQVALETGRKMLAEGGTSLDVVEQVVRHLEDDPLFNAGRGAVLNLKGEHELDASIMDGRDLTCGAVASVTKVQNPISLARKVMTETRHILLAGEGAEQFADLMGLPSQPADYFRTEAMIRQWERAQETRSETDDDSEEPCHELGEGASEEDEESSKMGTVGCVALDSHGNLAAATSTGGLLNKRHGRIGDSPIIGAGTYADNATCAVSCTGTGEEFMRRAAAHDVSALMAYRQLDVAEAVRIVVAEKLPPGSGAMIAVDREGNLTVQFNTAGIYSGLADSTGRFEVHLGAPD